MEVEHLLALQWLTPPPAWGVETPEPEGVNAGMTEEQPEQVGCSW